MAYRRALLSLCGEVGPILKRFLIDSGTEVSLVPQSPLRRRGRTRAPPLVAANGSNICSYGSRSVQLQFKGHVFSWKFVVADIPLGILSADFLRSHALMVDVRNKYLVDSTNLAVISCFSAASSMQRVLFVQTTNCPFTQLLCQRPAHTMPAFDCMQPTHRMELHIETSGPPRLRPSLQSCS